MTDDLLAEAGQEILEGPFEECPGCQGSGTHRERHQPMIYALCLKCDGAGRWVRVRFIWACDLLGCVEKSLQATLDVRKSAETTRSALKRARNNRLVEEALKQKEEKEKNRESLDQIIRRIAGNSNDYYGKQYRKNNKV